MDEIAVADNIKRLRLARGMTQADLATMVGTTQPTIARLETSKVANSGILPSVAVALGCNVEDLDPSFPRLDGSDGRPGPVDGTLEGTAGDVFSPTHEDVEYVIAALTRHAAKLGQTLGFSPTIKQALQNLLLAEGNKRSRP